MNLNTKIILLSAFCFVFANTQATQRIIVENATRNDLIVDIQNVKTSVKMKTVRKTLDIPNSSVAEYYSKKVDDEELALFLGIPDLEFQINSITVKDPIPTANIVESITPLTFDPAYVTGTYAPMHKFIQINRNIGKTSFTDVNENIHIIIHGDEKNGFRFSIENYN